MINFEYYISNFKRVFILANSKSEKKFENTFFNSDDLFIIFNKGISKHIINKLPNILWFHREDEEKKLWFGEEFVHEYVNIFHATIADSEIPAPKWSKFHLKTKEMPQIERYPIGKKIFNFKNKKKNRKIITPTTGFIVLMNLENFNYKKTIEIYSIGFGKFPNGWYGHDWQYERKAISKFKKIKPMTNRIKNDRFLFIRALIPNNFI